MAVRKKTGKKGVPWSEPPTKKKKMPKTYKGKSTKPGGGGRFAKMTAKLEGKVRDPAAVAAKIGRKKYGKKKMAEFSAAGRKRAAAKRRKKS